MKITTIAKIANSSYRARPILNHHDVAMRARVPVRSLLKYWKAGLIKPCNDCQRYGIYFEEEAIYRIRKAESIRDALQTNIASASLLLSFSEEINHLKQELRFFRESR